MSLDLPPSPWLWSTSTSCQQIVLPSLLLPWSAMRPPTPSGHERSNGYPDFVLPSSNVPSESEVGVDSDDSLFRAASLDTPTKGNDELFWMPDGDIERVWGTAFMFINDNGPIAAPAPYIHSILFTAAPNTHCQLIPSSQGHMLLKFDSKADQDTVANLSPIIHDDARLTIERAKESSNRFILDQPWLVAISVTEFPGEH